MGPISLALAVGLAATPTYDTIPARRAHVGLWVQRALDARLTNIELAAAYLTLARVAEAAMSAPVDLARAAYDLGSAASDLERPQLAYELMQLASDRARLSGERGLFAFLELARARVLRRAGALLQGEQIVAAFDPRRALASAAAAALTDRDRSLVQLELGLNAVDRSDWHEARAALRTALALSDRDEVVVPAEINLAYVAREERRFAAADAHLDRAQAAGGDPFDILVVRAQVMADRAGPGDLDRAAQLLATPGVEVPLHWRARVARWTGVVAWRRGDLATAEAALRDALDPRHAATSGRERPSPLAAYRPGEQAETRGTLIELYASQGRWSDVLGALAGMVPDGGLPIEAGPAVAAAWRADRLIAVVRGARELWRIEVRNGEASGRSLGALSRNSHRLEAAAERLRADPDDIASANILGDALVPRDATGRLHLFLSGGISDAPLAALRRDGKLVVASDVALVRVFAVARRTPASGLGDGRRIALGDPDGQLPAARKELWLVAARLGASLRLGADATIASVRGARGASLLHIAAHSTLALEGARLPLADGTLMAHDIAATLAPAPRTVVVASCGSATALAAGAWGSLAAGLIDAGSSAVVATSTRVVDSEAAAVVDAFYRHGGAEDAVIGLALAQRERAAANAPTRAWASFLVIGTPPAVDGQ